MKIKSQIENLKKLNLPTNDFVVVSSGALAIRNIREAKDLDVIVTDSLWNELIKKYKVTVNEWGIERIDVGNDIEILNPTQSMFGHSGEVGLEEIFKKADVFEDIKFISLEHLRKIKLKLGRERDLQDVELIDRYLSEPVPQSSVAYTLCFRFNPGEKCLKSFKWRTTNGRMDARLVVPVHIGIEIASAMIT